jgi:uncharacterized protein
MLTDPQWDHLLSLLQDMRSAVVAFSGGVDSSLLLRAAAEALGLNIVAVTADSATYPPGELEQARDIARLLGVRHRVLAGGELDSEAFVRNDPDRCYHCKRDLFVRLRQFADREGIVHVLDGTNADDLQDRRPGRRAAAELGVRSPLAEAGMRKADIRSLARKLALPSWDKPSLACLSSRIPYGTRITPALLSTVHAAEEAIRGLGFGQVRVRHHGSTARIEVERSAFALLLAGDAAERVVAVFKDLGYAYVCLDLEGYRSGSMNAVLTGEEAEARDR